MIIFYHGTDIYRLRQAVRALGPATSTLQANEPDDIIELERTLKYPSFFSEQKRIILRGILANAEIADTVHDLFAQHDVARLSDIMVIACQEGPSGRESASAKKLTAYLQKNSAQTTEFLPLQGIQLTHWINEFCFQRARTIEPVAASLVSGRASHDSWVLANELEKLCAYSDGIITADMVRLLVPAIREQDEFALSNALIAGNKRDAIAALWTRLRQGAAGQLLLGALAYATRTVLAVGDLAARRTPAGVIAKTLGLAPFVVTKTLTTISGRDLKKVAHTHTALAALDRNTKEGHVDLEDGLFSTLIDLS